MREIDVGQTIAGKYELVRLIGQGAMGAVWLARHDTLGEKFAIKLLTPDPSIDPEEASGRFQQEAQLSASLSQKTRHVVRVSDHGEEDGWAYLVMELLEGETLEARLARGPLEAAETADIIGQVARALTLAHAEGIVHRDLKPGNIFLTRDEDGRLVVKLLDFGIARSGRPRQTRSPFATAKDVVLGTPAYMSPEQARGHELLDHRCDLWALAVVAYECLTGTIPWDGDTLEDIFLSVCTNQWVHARERRPDLPYVVEAFFARAFAIDLDDRFGSAKELAATFRAAFPHTGNVSGGRAAFASRPSFDEDLRASTGKLPSPLPTAATLPASPRPAASPAPPPPVGSPARATPSPSPGAAAERERARDGAAGPPAEHRASSLRWTVGLAFVLAAVIVAALAAWATSASRPTGTAPVTSGAVLVEAPPSPPELPGPTAAPTLGTPAGEPAATPGTTVHSDARRRPFATTAKPSAAATVATAALPTATVSATPPAPAPIDKGEVF